MTLEPARKTNRLALLLIGTLVLGCILAVAQVQLQLSIKEESPQQALPKDPLQLLTSGKDVPRGQLAYIAYLKVPGQDWAQRYLTVRQTGQSETAAQKSQDVRYHVILNVEAPELPFDPQFSPTGEFITFKSGWPYDSPGYFTLRWWRLQKKVLGTLPLWDDQLRKTREYEPLPRDSLSYRRTQWSSDGNYLAYCFGGDNKGIEMKTLPLQLLIHDLKTKKSRTIAKNPAARSFTWTHQGTLLFCSLDTNSTPIKLGERPNIYEVDASKDEPKLVAEDGWWPTPSPDGEWIAFFTSTDLGKGITPKKPFYLQFPSDSYLCLYNRKTKKRVIVQSITASVFPELVWTPDSRSLLTLEAKSGANATQNEGHINQIDVNTMGKKEIAVLSAKDWMPFNDPPVHFGLNQVTKDGHYLLATSTDLIQASVKESWYDRMISLQAVNLADGSVKTIATFRSEQGKFLGFDWFDLSKPAAQAEPKRAE